MVSNYFTLSMSKYFLPYALKITGSKLIYQAGRETAFFSRPLKKAAIGKRISSFPRSLWDILRPFDTVQVGFNIQEVIKKTHKKSIYYQIRTLNYYRKYPESKYPATVRNVLQIHCK